MSSLDGGRMGMAGKRPRRGSEELSAPVIADIQRFSLDNGPGIRSTVFLKGCALRCAWCHNPEFQEFLPQVYYRADSCIGCRACLAACSRALTADGPDEATCSECGRCAQACPTGALRRVGTRMDPGHLASILLEDLPFYKASDGGVTFSGGEPGLFARYCADAARILKKHSIHIALQTAGMFHWEEFAGTILPLVDLVYFDLKTAGFSDHQRLTGCPREPIIENFRRLAASPVQLIATTVLVPGVNDNPEAMKALLRFVVDCGVTQLLTRSYLPENGAKRRRILATPLRCLGDRAFPVRHATDRGAA